MLKKCKYVPVLETKRLIMREPIPDDAGDLKEWFGLEEVYQYWGNPPGKGEKNPEMLFVDPRPKVIVWKQIDGKSGTEFYLFSNSFHQLDYYGK